MTQYAFRALRVGTKVSEMPEKRIGVDRSAVQTRVESVNDEHSLFLKRRILFPSISSYIGFADSNSRFQESSVVAIVVAETRKF